ncbi:MAG TPA: hypothetical protein PLZ32_20930 [Saprospiraceae bacterium]|nr:hypothetical protein [Saprospiraceae bacterium]
MNIPSTFKSRFLWTVGLIGIAVLLVMSVRHKSQSNVKELVVHIKPIKGDRDLINKKEVEGAFKKMLGYDVREAKVVEVNLSELEQLLMTDDRVKKAEVFLDSKNRLTVWLVQRQPIVRIVDERNFSYYIDEDGDKIQTRKGVAVRVPLATGYIGLYDKESLFAEKKSTLKDVFLTSKSILADPFIEALVEQIDVTEDHDLLLIPKIGRQEILIGNAENIEDKFNNLKSMYKDGIPMVGWDKYKGINLKYKGQVIGEL